MPYSKSTPRGPGVLRKLKIQNPHVVTGIKSLSTAELIATIHRNAQHAKAERDIDGSRGLDAQLQNEMLKFNTLRKNRGEGELTLPGILALTRSPYERGPTAAKKEGIIDALKASRLRVKTIRELSQQKTQRVQLLHALNKPAREIIELIQYRVEMLTKQNGNQNK